MSFLGKFTSGVVDQLVWEYFGKISPKYQRRKLRNWENPGDGDDSVLHMRNRFRRSYHFENILLVCQRHVYVIQCSNTMFHFSHMPPASGLRVSKIKVVFCSFLFSSDKIKELVSIIVFHTNINRYMFT